MSFSFWEKETWFRGLDLLVVGGGMVGLSAAIHYKRKNPNAKVLVVERGILPNGASTKNAGFVCFGSPSELTDDLSHFKEDELLSTIEMRFKGYRELRKLLTDKQLGYQASGGYELFRKADSELYEQSMNHIDSWNKSLKLVFGQEAFIPLRAVPNEWKMKGIEFVIGLPNEGQIDTGKTMFNLQRLAQSEGILQLNGLNVLSIDDIGAKVEVTTNEGVFFSDKVAICTNGFAQKLLQPENGSVLPARAQVFITEPIDGLPFQGIFHMHKGYYYFRNVGKRLLLGGGRHLQRKTEQTYRMQTTAKIQNHLRRIAKRHILPQTSFEISDSWAGIMGFGGQNEKGCLVQKISDRVACGVRLGGMGIAIGTEIGRRTAGILTD